MIPDFRIALHCGLCKEEILIQGLCKMGCKYDAKLKQRPVIVVSYKKDKEREEERIV